MRSCFRTPGEWKAALTTMQDGPFFDLMRGYLGALRTPFNKQRLVDELAALLSRKDIQNIIESYLDDTDRNLIAAVCQLGEPSTGELAAFFEGEYSFAELHGILLNLEERLILYRLTDKHERPLSLNPVLKPMLAKYARQRAALFPSIPLDDSPVDSLSQELILPGILSFLYDKTELYKADGTVKKKIEDEGSRIFSSLNFEAALGALRSLGILKVDKDSHHLDEERIDALGTLSSQERRCYLAAGYLAFYLNIGFENRRLSRDQLQAWALLAQELKNRLSLDRAYPEATLHRLSDILERSLAAPRRRWDEEGDPASDFRSGLDPSVFRKALVAALVAAGLLTIHGDGQYRPVMERTLGKDREPSRPGIALDASFSCVLYPELPFKDAIALARFCSVRDVGPTARFEITRESVVRGFDLNLKPNDFILLLDRLSMGRVDQSLRWSLEDWYARYAGVSVHRGLTLVLQETQRYLREAEPLASLVHYDLAPGVYLLSTTDEKEVLGALKKLGVDIVALPSEPRLKDRGGSEYHLFASLCLPTSKVRGHRLRDEEPEILSENIDIPSYPASDPSSLLSTFRTVLDARKLPKDQREELAARIERRLILRDDQLVSAAVRYERLEAKGLDYVGKVRVAEQALSSSSLVELFWRGPKGEPNRILATPVGLEKSEGELMLIVDPAPRGERMSIAIGKISLLRRIKRSIFGE